MKINNYIQVGIYSAGFFGGLYHTYILDNKLFKGYGYTSKDNTTSINYKPDTDQILLDDISGMNKKELTAWQ